MYDRDNMILLQFKQLMLKFDPDEDEEDGENAGTGAGGGAGVKGSGGAVVFNQRGEMPPGEMTAAIPTEIHEPAQPIDRGTYAYTTQSSTVSTNILLIYIYLQNQINNKKTRLYR